MAVRVSALRSELEATRSSAQSKERFYQEKVQTTEAAYQMALERKEAERREQSSAYASEKGDMARSIGSLEAGLKAAKEGAASKEVSYLATLEQKEAAMQKTLAVEAAKARELMRGSEAKQAELEEQLRDVKAELTSVTAGSAWKDTHYMERLQKKEAQQQAALAAEVQIQAELTATFEQTRTTLERRITKMQGDLKLAKEGIMWKEQHYLEKLQEMEQAMIYALAVEAQKQKEQQTEFSASKTELGCQLATVQADLEAAKAGAASRDIYYVQKLKETEQKMIQALASEEEKQAALAEASAQKKAELSSRVAALQADLERAKESSAYKETLHLQQLEDAHIQLKKGLAAKEEQLAVLGTASAEDKQMLVSEAEALRIEIAELEADLAKAMDWWITADMRYVSLQESAENKEGMYVQKLDKMQAEMKVDCVPWNVPW
jgi:hypothetical protein